jgi:glutamine amidotransferase
MIGIINYGLGNINSIKNVLDYIGVKSRILNSVDDSFGVSKYILPGVGSFDAGMNGLINGKWVELLNEEVVKRDVPLLGICLGMQLMCLKSEEGVLPGLGLINAEVKRFSFSNDSQLKVPHMGWNTVKVIKDNPLVSLTSDEIRFYFVHSFHVECNRDQDRVLSSNYGIEFDAMFMDRNIFGVQFHPEKSHKFGFSLLSNFCKV